MINLYSQKWIAWQRIYMGKDVKPLGFTFWPFIFYRNSKEEVPSWLRLHEEFHWWHQLKWLVIPYHLIYVILWIFYGYKDHPWEKLARLAERGY